LILFHLHRKDEAGMGNRNIFLILLGLCFLISTVQAGVEPVAIVIKARGKVYLVQGSSKKGHLVKRGQRIAAGQSIFTKAKSFAIVKFIDNGGVVRIQANSLCRFGGKRVKRNLAKNIYLEVGTVFSKVFKNKGGFRVGTPTSVASVKGTAFWTKQKFKGPTYYFGEEGVVEISNKSGVALLKAGMTGYVLSPNSKPIVRKTRKGEKPVIESEDQALDEFDLEFEDANGHTKSLKFKIQKNKK